MKKLLVLTLALMLALTLCACGSGEKAAADDPNVGKYLCTSVVMEGMELGADGEYLDLQADGVCEFYFYESPDSGTWSLDGETLTMTVPYADMDLNATGTLKDGVITMTIPELGDATMTFQLEGIEEAAPAEEEAPAEGTEEAAPAEEETPAEETEEAAPAEEAPAEETTEEAAAETAPAEEETPAAEEAAQ